MRKATGRDDIYGVALAMSVEATDTHTELDQFAFAYTRRWPPPARWNLVEEPATRAILIEALERYAAIHRTGCTPPDAVSWTNVDNNRAFLEQRVVMVANPTLSIPAVLRTARPDDYYQNAATIDWPQAANGKPLVLEGRVDRAVVFKEGGHAAVAKDFIRFLAEWGLAHWVTSMGDQYMPPMRKLVEQPFWLDATDPHRMRAAIQILTQPHQQTNNGVRDNEWRSSPIWMSTSGAMPCTASSPTASAPSRRSTRRSPGSRRS